MNFPGDFPGPMPGWQKKKTHSILNRTRAVKVFSHACPLAGIILRGVRAKVPAVAFYFSALCVRARCSFPVTNCKNVNRPGTLIELPPLQCTAHTHTCVKEKKKRLAASSTRQLNSNPCTLTHKIVEKSGASAYRKFADEINREIIAPIYTRRVNSM